MNKTSSTISTVLLAGFIGAAGIHKSGILIDDKQAGPCDRVSSLSLPVLGTVYRSVSNAPYCEQKLAELLAEHGGKIKAPNVPLRTDEPLDPNNPRHPCHILQEIKDHNPDLGKAQGICLENYKKELQREKEISGEISAIESQTAADAYTLNESFRQAQEIIAKDPNSPEAEKIIERTIRGIIAQRAIQGDFQLHLEPLTHQ